LSNRHGQNKKSHSPNVYSEMANRATVAQLGITQKASDKLSPPFFAN